MSLGSSGRAKNFWPDIEKAFEPSGRQPASLGAIVDKRLKSLMEQLGEAINNSLSDSDQIADVITRIKDGGYDVFLVLEATVGFNERDEGEEPAAADERVAEPRRSTADFQVTSQDVEFLKSLRISADE
jgi:hypothetical protein